MEFSTVVLRNFGAFVPGLTGGGGGGGGDASSSSATHVKSMREGCGQLFCSKRCLGTADIYWPQVLNKKLAARKETRPIALKSIIINDLYSVLFFLSFFLNQSVNVPIETFTMPSLLVLAILSD